VVRKEIYTFTDYVNCQHLREFSEGRMRDDSINVRDLSEEKCILIAILPQREPHSKDIDLALQRKTNWVGKFRL
jgi:hypothetical protein